MDEKLTAEIVQLAYLMFFYRPPENEEVVRYALSFGTLGRLCEAFRNSLEFEMTLNRRPRLVRADAAPLVFDWRIDDAGALALLARLRAAWCDTPAGPPADAGAMRDPDGSMQADELLACLRRAGIDPAALPCAFVFGCGGGRVTRQLAARFATVAGCDLSPLRLAAAAGSGYGPLLPVEDLHFGMTEPFDLWYSYLVLQSYPPPLIARILQRAFALLRPGGAAVFQLPTYAYGYTLDLDAPPRAAPALDRHVLPQAAVFEIAATGGCAPAEVFDDLAVTPNTLWRSTVFVMRKHGGD